MSDELKELIALCKRIGYTIKYRQISAKFSNDPASYLCTSMNLGDFLFVSPMGNRHLDLWYIQESKVYVALDEKKHSNLLRCLKMILLIHDQTKAIKRIRTNMNTLKDSTPLQSGHRRSTADSISLHNSTTRQLTGASQFRRQSRRLRESTNPSQSVLYTQSRKRKRGRAKMSSQTLDQRKRIHSANISELDHRDVSAALLLCSIRKTV